MKSIKRFIEIEAGPNRLGMVEVSLNNDKIENFSYKNFPKENSDLLSFYIHSQLIDQLFGASEDIVVGRISNQLLLELKAEFCSNDNFSKDISLYSSRFHSLLRTNKFSDIELQEMRKNIIPGNMHEFCYKNKIIKKLHDELRLIFKRYVGSPFVFINTRIWKTLAGAKTYGSNDWHKDGFLPGHLKIMLYLTPLNSEYGKFSWRDSKGNEYHLDDEPAGTTVCFKNSDLEHAGIPGKIYDRISIEVTLMRSLVDGQQEWPGHFFGRHFKGVKQLASIKKINTFLDVGMPLSKLFTLPDFNGVKKVNIGSGKRNWPEWVCLDELKTPGVTEISFSSNSKFPIEAQTVSLFYSSHFFEHISDEVVFQILSEMKRCALPGAFFVLKIPDFSWFLQQYKYNVKDCMNDKGLEKVLSFWESNGVEDNIENRVASMFCMYWNHAYGDHFSGAINHYAEGAYHGPPKLPIEKIKEILAGDSPHKIAKDLVSFANKDKDLKTFNHRNAWSEAEICELLSKFDIEVLHFDKNLILDQFHKVIPDIENMHNWSAFYLCKFPD